MSGAAHPITVPLTADERHVLAAPPSRAVMDGLYEAIGFADDVRARLRAVDGCVPCDGEKPSDDGTGDAVIDEIAALFEPERWNDAVARLTLLSRDPSGMRLLAWFMRAAAVTRARYAAQGIDDAVFRATMGFFPRFLERRRAAYGDIRFDQEFWAPRQIAMTILRIGELEFEFAGTGRAAGESASSYVGVHIPSDARLDGQSLLRTLRAYHRFVSLHRPAFAGCPLRCDSWLLDPSLEPMLPAGSRIGLFRSLFDVDGLQYGDDYKQWLCGRADMADADLPERTSLQRAVKAFVLGGGRMGIGYGTLRADALRRLEDAR